MDHLRSDDDLRTQLTQALVWKELPLEELQEECHAYGLSPDAAPIDESTDDTRARLFKQLVTSMLGDRAVIWRMPVHCFGGQDKVDLVLKRIEHLQIMGLLTLRSEWRRHHLEVDEMASRQALADGLRDVFIWKELALSDLKRECRERGLDS